MLGNSGIIPPYMVECKNLGTRCNSSIENENDKWLYWEVFACSGLVEIVYAYTVNADIFAGLIFRIWQLKNIFAGC